MRMRRSESFEGFGDNPRERDRGFDSSGTELGLPLVGDADDDQDTDSDITDSDITDSDTTDGDTNDGDTVDRSKSAKRGRRGQSHHAASWGGYDAEEDDFDYDEFLEKEFGRSDHPTPKPWWWYVAWVVLFVLVVGILVDAITLVYPRPR